MLKGKTISPGREPFHFAGIQAGAFHAGGLAALFPIYLASGARVLECACGPCIGMGFSPNSGRCFPTEPLTEISEGRSGTADGQRVSCFP